MPALLPHYTIDDLAHFPDDGYRYELDEGHLLAVEVSGRGSRIYDRDYKRPAYLAAGVREFWRVDLRDRCLYVATADAPDERAITDAVTWTPPDGGRGVTVHIAELFEGISDTAVRE